MPSKVIENLKGLSQEDKAIKVEEWRRELFGLRLSSSTTHIKDYSQFKKLRKNIARGLTLLNQEQPEIKAQSITAEKE